MTDGMTSSASYPAAAGASRNGASGLFIVAAAVMLLLGCFGPNAALTALAVLSFLLGAMLLWRPGQPPILLFVFLTQWLQASVAIFQATWAGVPVDDFSELHGSESTAIVLTQLALLVQAVGLKLGAGPIRMGVIAGARELAERVAIKQWFRAYLAFAVVGVAASYAAGRAPGLSQLLGGVASLRWAFFFMVAFAFFVRRLSSGIWFYIAFAWELMTGLGGYFSDFKTVFIVSLLALVASGTRASGRFIASSAVIVSAAVLLMVVWTAIKQDYRDFVSGGETAQIVTVEYSERLNKIGELVGQLDAQDLSDASQQLLRRISYVDYFGVVLDRVPSVVPHENGAILKDALLRPFTPRLLFPGKDVIDDSLRTRKFTGIHVAGSEEGTSIGIGWPAELYIDFGEWFMMPVAFALGLAYGGVQRFFLNWRYSRGLLGLGVSFEILLAAGSVEMSITKLIGGLVVSFVAAWLVIRFAVPGVWPWLIERRR